MPDYQNGKIYMLTTQKNCKVYIGSTTTTLNTRLTEHSSSYKRWLCGYHKNYITAYEVLEFDDCKIELIEEYPCENLTELHKRECYHLKLNIDFIVNRYITGKPKGECDYEKKRRITRREKYMCVVCNKELCIGAKYKHDKTATHIKNYNRLNPVSV